ncbi:MAG: hypothetical protein CMO99_00130 [Woeseiaceae bacterium]|nr:hypothetical protein [Woeseiaceae bacterium]
MSIFHNIFLYLVIGIFPTIPFVAIYLFLSKKKLREIPRSPLIFASLLMGWLLNIFFEIF